MSSSMRRLVMRQAGWPARGESRSANRHGYADKDERIMAAVARLVIDLAEGTGTKEQRGQHEVRRSVIDVRFAPNATELLLAAKAALTRERTKKVPRAAPSRLPSRNAR